MSKEQKEEFRKNGFIIFELWQVVLTVITIVFAVGIFYATTRTTLETHEKKIVIIEKWDKRIDETSYNVQAICKKLGIDYIKTENK